MKIRLIGSLALLLFVVLVLLTPLEAADAKLTVVVKKDTGELAPPGVTVNMIDMKADPPTTAQQKTNKKGEAEFKKAEGVFRVAVRVEGFEPAFVDYLVIGPGEQKTIELVLKPGDSTKKLYFEDMAATQAAAGKLFMEGNQLLQQGKFVEAEAKFREALAIDRYLPEYRQNLAVALVYQGKWDEGKKELENGLADVATLKMTGRRVAELEALEQRLQMLIGKLPQLRLQAEADEDLKASRYDQAIAKYQEFLKTSPPKEEAAAVMYNMALAHARAGQFDQARKVIDEVVAANPNDANAAQLKKMLYENEKQMALKQAIGRINAGADALSQGKPEEALKIYQDALAVSPPEAHRDLWLGIARSQKALGHDQEMLDAYKKTIELSKEKVPVAQEVATYLFSKDRPADAIQILSDTYKLTGQPADEGLFAMGMSFSKKTATKKYAKALFEEVQKQNPQHAESKFELGMIYFYDEPKDPVKAKEMLTSYSQIGKDTSHVESAKAVLLVIEKKPAAPAAKPKAPAGKK